MDGGREVGEDGLTDGWIDERTDGWIDACMHALMYGWTGGLMDGWINEWRDGGTIQTNKKHSIIINR